MNLINTDIPDVKIIEPAVFKDERGYFYESYNKDKFKNIGISDDFVQDNQSKSQKNVLRGLHFQKPPFAQAKLVRVIAGAVLDIVVDIRRNSPYYGKYVAVELTEENMRQLYVPAGFAHGFLTLADNTIFAYKCSAFYNKESEDSILWNDSTLSIDWGIEKPLVSEKDKTAKPFKSLITFFEYSNNI